LAVLGTRNAATVLADLLADALLAWLDAVVKEVIKKW
jgi:hypothetical protein